MFTPDLLLNKFNSWLNQKTRLVPSAYLHWILGVLVVVIAVLTGLFTGWAAEGSMKDQDSFGLLARHFADYNNFDGSVRRGPLYPFTLGLLFRWFGASNFTVIGFQSGLLAVLALLTYVLSKKLYGSWKLALITGLVVALHPMCVVYVSKILVELLFAPLVLLMIWFAYRSLVHDGLLNPVLAGFFAGMAALCKAVTLLYPLFFACGTLVFYLLRIPQFRNLSRGTLVRLFLIPNLFLLITISPWTLRNYHLTGELIPVSKGVGYEFLRGEFMSRENGYLLQNTNDEVWAKFQMEYMRIVEEYDCLDDEKQTRVLDSLMKAFIIEEPGQFALHITKQLPTFWYRGENFKKSMFYLVLAVVSLGLFLLGFVKTFRENIFGFSVLMSIIYFNLLYASILAIARYSMPVYPPMLLLGLYGLYRILRSQIGVIK